MPQAGRLSSRRAGQRHSQALRGLVSDVGLTAAVRAALADAGSSCKVMIAGYHHGHLLVALERVARALDVLQELGARRRPQSAVTTAPPRRRSRS